MEDKEQAQIEKQLKFVEWLKSHNMYNELATAFQMQSSMAVWEVFQGEALLPQWIPVSERLPTEEGLYAIQWDNGNYDMGTKDYVLAHNAYKFKWLGPLPQPPKEG